MNQCRPCHETCYTCDGFSNVSCLSCTGDLYLNPNLRACIPNCELYALTASLTIPNMCTLFDAIAVLVNVNEVDLINPSNFTYIEAAVTEATATGWKPKWKLDFNKTKLINNNTVTLDPAGPFSENPPSTNLKAGLKPSFFEPGKKYNFILEIIRSNEEYSVSVSKNWTLNMNFPPEGGELKVTPNAGYRITTYFLMTCDGWSTKIPFPMTYRFYSREINTNITNDLTDWMNITYTNANFSVRYYQLEFSTVQVTCEVKDGFDMIARSSKNITIVNTPQSSLYNLTQALESYKYKETLDQLEIKQRSQYLYSLGVNIFKDVQPKSERLEIVNALDFSRFEVQEPVCIQNYCNFRADCFEKIDIYIYCNCQIGYVGKYCQVDKEGYPSLAAAYQNLFNVVQFSVSETITNEQLTAIWNLIRGAGEFHQDPSFFNTNVQTWMDLVKSNFKDSVLKNKTTYFDMYDSVFSHTKQRLKAAKFQNKNSTNYPLRNVSLLADQKTEFQEAINKNRIDLEALIEFIITNRGTTKDEIKYESDNFYVASTLISPTFNATDYFKDRIKNYRSWASFMKCINYIMIERLNNPFFSLWFVFIEYKDYPFSYDLSIYQNSVSPLITLYFIDAITNKPVIVEGCNNDPISLYVPFNSPEWVEEVNQQKELYKPKNYLGPNDPIFKSPIFINATGFVSNDTIEERIATFARRYNFTCNFYDDRKLVFDGTGLEFADLDNSNFLVCNSTHTTDFNSFITVNDVKYDVDGPFFYLKFPQVFTYWPNYVGNLAFFVIAGLLGLYVIAIIITSLWDWSSYRQEVLLEFLKFNIVKVQMPYNQNITFNPNQNFPIDDFIGYDGKHRDDGVNAEDRFGKDEDPVDIAFRPKIGGKDLGDNIMKPKIVVDGENKGSGPFGLDFGVEDARPKAKGDTLALFNDDVFNLGDDLNPAIDEKNMATNNPFISDGDRDFMINMNNNKIEFGDVNVGHLDVKGNGIPDNQGEEEDEERETEMRLSAFASLNLSTCEFFCWNVRSRHVVISPVINSSLFNPRYKKFTCVLTELAIMMMILAVLLTNDQTVLISPSTSPPIISNVNKVLIYAILAVFASNFVMYFLVWLFRMTTDQRKLLFKTVKKAVQMRILRVWDEVEKKNLPFTVLGMFLNYTLTLGSFYFTFNYVAVWTAWDITWLITWGVAVFIDLVICEFGFEFIISCFYYFREGSPTMK
jgi:hypothetical protein